MYKAGRTVKVNIFAICYYVNQRTNKSIKHYILIFFSMKHIMYPWQKIVPKKYNKHRYYNKILHRQLCLFKVSYN